MISIKSTATSVAAIAPAGLVAYLLGASLNTGPRALADSQPRWDEAAWAEWRAKPRYDQEVAGVLLGPDVQPEFSACRAGELTGASPSRAAGTALDIPLPDLLTGSPGQQSSLDLWESEALQCAGQLVAHVARYGVPAAPDAEQRVHEGQDPLTVARGGWIEIHRTQLGPSDRPALKSDVPAGNWYEGDVAGHPAAIGRPVLDGGLGTSVVVVWDDISRVLTSVYTYNLSKDEAITVAEGMMR